MDSRLMGIFAAAVLALASPAFGSEPSSADKETARGLMEQGRDLRDAKDLNGALQRFSAADQIMHVPTTAFEVAQTQAMLGMLVEARDMLARILNTPARPGEPRPFREARAKAQKLDDDLAARMPAVVVRLHGAPDNAGATVTVDGVAMPSAVIGLSRAMNPGHHVIAASTAKMEGRAEVDVGEAEKKEVTVELTPKAAPGEEHDASVPLAKETPVVAPQGNGGARTFGLIMFGVGAAALAAGAVTGVLTLTTQADLSTQCPNHICGPASRDELSTANTLALVSTISFAAAGGFAVIGLVSYLVGKPKAEAPPPAQARVEPWLGLGAAGLRGTF
ncbi:MAG TPA: hypothetical protein VLM85_31980 [Polyangiaceae bacterium]|nr:hypothetical protein [Polyangiaceae bacterium]